MFTGRASARGATVTLVLGTVLGAIAFWALRSPEIVAQLPRYLRSPLNCGFVITMLCAVAMMLVSATAKPAIMGGESDSLANFGAGAKLIGAERTAFRIVLGALIIVWLGVTFVFSPWGLASPRRPPAAMLGTGG